MDSKIIDIMIQAVGQTVYMVFFSTLFASILGFIYVFLNNIEKYDGYSSKTLDISNQIISTMEEIAKTYDFTNQCGSKKATVKKQLNDGDEVDN